MKLKQLFESEWPKTLTTDGLVKHVLKTSQHDEDEESIEAWFDGRTAKLKTVEVSWLKRQDDVELRGDDYSDMSPDTCPPIIVDKNGEIQDGAHRYEAAKVRGEKTMLAYVLD